MTTTEIDQDQMIEALVRRARALAAEIKDLSETKKAIEARLEEIVPVGWKATIDDIQASRKLGNRSFDPALALASFTEAEKLTCVSTGVDLKMVRGIADAKGITESCMVEPDASKTRVTLS